MCGELRARDVLARDHIAETMNVVTVFVVALVTALATGLGALPFVFARRPDRAWLGTANSLAAGLMLGASAGLLHEGSRYGAERTALCARGWRLHLRLAAPHRLP